ncbi:G patch domain-containing protein 3 [Brienomyrus brachyistius]|uniref:G patch domain-containing protein 3 n=1 Tax=Brienomyrus brachyistius TaxID=42636 RepID=UPI0020B1BB52|nr:G patch domain-containing protein 3 [Brienomyrus brachyistius]XP_048882105.1 G patch domain-containing protein 3 [Brienomyrus brachyistius]
MKEVSDVCVMADSCDIVYFAVSNIPATFRSADLRNYFSQFIEDKGFVCFHYRHRPEILRDTAESGAAKDPQDAERRFAAARGEKTCCCIVSVRGGEDDRFIRMYAGNHWVASLGDWLGRRCVLRRIRVSDEPGESSFPYKTRAELNRHTASTEQFTDADLRRLPEMNPPALMPAGNVGTPVTVFLQLIQACRLPPRLIRKLGLTFPKTSSRHRYGNVPFKYQDTYTITPTQESVYTAGGVEISGPGRVSTPPAGTPGPDAVLEDEETTASGPEEVESGPDDDDDRCEEWERHEALHEDVTSQERSKERLYEEEIELKWEKGGSGLVFYTDAQYWQEEEEGDFDEQTADDWDVDMSVYYDKDGGDMDARDYVRMRHERRLREGLETPSDRQQPIGSFEKFTKGVGRRVMEKQGWRDGEGLGHSQAGMADALVNEGQHPRCKRGLGYHGEKLSSFLPVKKPRQDFLISTVYDQPKDIDRGDTLLRRQPTTSMKYKEWQPGGSMDHNR